MQIVNFGDFVAGLPQGESGNVLGSFIENVLQENREVNASLVFPVNSKVRVTQNTLKIKNFVLQENFFDGKHLKIPTFLKAIAGASATVIGGSQLQMSDGSIQTLYDLEVEGYGWLVFPVDLIEKV